VAYPRVGVVRIAATSHSCSLSLTAAPDSGT
jgi:hypothetical protein